ncbi:hypothetical protein FA95DRAFT_225433 [Auriscalpium vulgare]|uniref:Uncharacterized protein n=1 Tax=Auriscalpium vulgare TaxID=40419 RepID=A0ACB8RL64_9AGAM|nr:hypothetical protein FA95DRAFT_225433 [Auriscalpium vulgare]
MAPRRAVVIVILHRSVFCFSSGVLSCRRFLSSIHPELRIQIVCSVPNPPAHVNGIRKWTRGGVTTTETCIIVVLTGHQARNCKLGPGSSAHHEGNVVRWGRQYNSRTQGYYQANNDLSLFRPC